MQPSKLFSIPLLLLLRPTFPLLVPLSARSTPVDPHKISHQLTSIGLPFISRVHLTEEALSACKVVFAALGADSDFEFLLAVPRWLPRMLRRSSGVVSDGEER